jgi:hypothetical protein
MKWSLSALGVFEKCQLQYRFRYIDKLLSQRGEAASRGVEKHKIFEDVMTGARPALPMEFSYYEGYIKELKAQQIFPEHKVALTRDWQPTTWEDGWFRGILDVKVLKSESEAGVVDWKTGKIYADHDDQKSIYSLATFAEHPAVQRVRAVHVYIDLGQQREKVYDRSEMHGMRSKWESRVTFLERTDPQDMIPSPGYHCRYCPYSAKAGGPCRF